MTGGPVVPATQTRRWSKPQKWWNFGHDWHVGRLSFGVCPSALILPRVTFGADGPHGDEYETRYIALNVGNGNSDPLLYVELQLTNTRAGRLLAEVVWWFRERRWRNLRNGGRDV